MKHLVTITVFWAATLGLASLTSRADDAPSSRPTAAAAAIAMDPIPAHLTTNISPLDHRDDIQFHMTRETKLEGTTESVRNTYTDKDGKEVVVETAFIDKGHIVSFHQDQKQWNSSGDMIVKDGKVHFTYTREGKTKTAEDDAGADFVVTASLMNYVREHWSDIVKGKAVKFKLGALERREVVAFEIKKEKEMIYNGQPAYVLKMSPSSMFIAALVNPIFFTSTTSGDRLWEIDGRTPLKFKKGDAWKDYDGHTVYVY